MEWIELVGYAGSLLVLVSFLMTSVFKLRVVNTIGSLIFAGYALAIHSYPTAIMNICLVLINLHFLWTMRTTSRAYELTQMPASDAYVSYLLAHYADDIKNCFPDFSYENPPVDAKALVVMHDANPVGLTLTREVAGALEVDLDYSLPVYRDFSIGSFVYDELTKQGVKLVRYVGSLHNHESYLERMGFSRVGEVYERTL